MLGSVPHLERVLENGDKLLDLSIVKDSGGDPPLGGKPLQEVHPLGPLPVLRPFHGPHVLSQRDGELVLGHKVVGTLRQPVVDLVENVVLFLDMEVGWQVRKLSLLHGNHVRRRTLQELVWTIKLVSVRRPSLRARFVVLLLWLVRRENKVKPIVQRVIGQARRRNDIIHRSCRRVSALAVPGR